MEKMILNVCIYIYLFLFHISSYSYENKNIREYIGKYNVMY